jgi:K(+)-stimulated pyrophosphate-energized sodium pump
MFNIFLGVFFATLAFAFFDVLLLHRLPRLHRPLRPLPGHLHGQRRRRLGQRQEDRRDRPAYKGTGRGKGTDLHAATVVGDTVGDPFKDTSSVAMNPVIKFTTLFGLLAVELAISMKTE